MLDFNLVIETDIAELFSRLIETSQIREKKKRKIYIIVGVLIVTVMLSVCKIPVEDGKESNSININLSVKVETEDDGQEESTEGTDLPECVEYVYENISHGSEFRRGDQVFTGGQLVNTETGSSKYVYQVRSIDETDEK